jgi:hypothetical protein
VEPEAVQAAVLAAAGEVQALMNHLGLASRSSSTAKLAFESDLRAALRRALQFGRSEAATIDTPLASSGPLAQPADVVVAAKTKVPQLAVEIQWHPRGEDHAAFANAAVGDVVKMVLAKTKGAVEQAMVLVGAPARFWRWLPGYAEDRRGYELLNPSADTPASSKSDFLAGGTWDFLFENGMETQLPDRLWAALVDTIEIRSPWAETEVRLFDVKGLGVAREVRD